MKGRGNPPPQGRGKGGGYFAGRGRGAGANNHLKGNIPTIGAYLDLQPGKDIVPGTVTKFMGKMKEHAMTTLKSKVSLIFGADGTLGDYPVLAIPPPPGEGATQDERDIWKLERVEYIKARTKLEEDKQNLYGAMVGQMSENSKIRVKEVTVGVQADSEQDPRKLMQAILATHVGDSTLGAEHQMHNIQQRYDHLVMLPHEHLSTYLTNTKSALTAIQQAFEAAGRTEIDELYPEGRMAVKFILGLNNYYSEFKNFYINNLKVWPNTLEESYNEASKFKPTKVLNNSPAAMERANAFAMTGRGGKSGRGGYPGGHNGKSAPGAKWVKDGADSPDSMSSERGSPAASAAVYTASATPPKGYKRGPCNNCGKFGHLAYECRGNAADTVAQYWNEEGARSPGGKSNTAPGKGKGK